MIGYNKEEAIVFIQKHLQAAEYSSLPISLHQLVSQAIQGDFDYMYETGILDDEGYGANVYYDEDDAFEFILESIINQNQFESEKALQAAIFVNDFMEYQFEYLQQKGLVITD